MLAVASVRARGGGGTCKATAGYTYAEGSGGWRSKITRSDPDFVARRTLRAILYSMLSTLSEFAAADIMYNNADVWIVGDADSDVRGLRENVAG